MNLLSLWNNSAAVIGSASRADRMAQAAASEENATPTSFSDLAWQHAMEHAQQGELTDWFKALPPSDANASLNSQSNGSALPANTLPFIQFRASVKPDSGSQAEPATSMGIPNDNRGSSDDLGGATEVHSARGTANANQAASSSDSSGTRSADLPASDTAIKQHTNDRDILSEASKPGGAAGSLVDQATAASNLSETSPVNGFLSPALADALSSASGLTVSPVASLDALAGMSAVAPNALPVMTADTLSASIVNESVPQDAPATEQSSRNLSKPQIASAGSDSSEPSREPVRLYSEWTKQGVRIWLGADADQKLPLAQLTQQLQRWLAGQGESLITLVCNGRTLWQRDAATQAPDPLPQSSTSSGDQLTPEFTKSNLLSTLSQRNHQEVLWQSVQ